LLRALAEYPATGHPNPLGKDLPGDVVARCWAGGTDEKIIDSLSRKRRAGGIDGSNLAFGRSDSSSHCRGQVTNLERSRAPDLATEWLAESYYRQAQARESQTIWSKRSERRARQSRNRPTSVFGWARVAELEFSFSVASRNRSCAGQSLELAPRNAEARPLKGYLLGAQNRIRPAILYFEQAIAVDGALAQRLLGAASVESTGKRGGRTERIARGCGLGAAARLLRSYLGKAYTDAGDTERAAKELRLAQKLDPERSDGLVVFGFARNNKTTRSTTAVRDLEKSQELNNNRQVYRSRCYLTRTGAVADAQLQEHHRASRYDFRSVALRTRGSWSSTTANDKPGGCYSAPAIFPGRARRR